MCGTLLREWRVEMLEKIDIQRVQNITWPKCIELLVNELNKVIEELQQLEARYK